MNSLNRKKTAKASEFGPVMSFNSVSDVVAHIKQLLAADK